MLTCAQGSQSHETNIKAAETGINMTYILLQSTIELVNFLVVWYKNKIYRILCKRIEAKKEERKEANSKKKIKWKVLYLCYYSYIGTYTNIEKVSLRETCLCSEFFWSIFSLNVGNTDQKNSKCGHFLHSVCCVTSESFQTSIRRVLTFKPLSTNHTKWSDTLRQFLGNKRRNVWVCLTILWGWRLKA